jgi:transcriptional regulator with PAS, ATPase and Fis domain
LLYGNVGFWRWHVGSGQFHINSSWFQTLGYSPFEYKSTHSFWKSLIHPDDLEGYKRRSKACLQGNSALFHCRFRIRSPHGGYYWEESVGFKIRSYEDGRPAKLRGFIQNIDLEMEFKRRAGIVAEYSHLMRFVLHYMISKGIDIASIVDSPLFDFGKSRDEYDLLLAVIGCGKKWDDERRTGTYFVKDSSFKYVYVSQGMADLIGIPILEFLGQTDEELFGSQPQSDESLMERFKQEIALSSRQNRIVEGRAVPFADELTYFKFGILAGEDSDDEDEDVEDLEIGAIIYVLGFPQLLSPSEANLELEDTLERPYISPAMQKTLKLAHNAAQSDSTVLLTGERGSGKDYVAQYIHDHSKRAAGPFFPINCAAISPQLVESELFGHEAGAYTGALKSGKLGQVEMAEGGTLFLNEIGELESTSQAKLLSFLEKRSFTRVGGTRTINVNARLVVATNRRLEKEVEEGRFRADLFDRLNVVKIDVPPLRKRKEDIPALIKEFLKEFRSKGLTRSEQIDSETLAHLKRYDWMGNVRELKNRVERALVTEPGKKLTWSSIFSDLSENREAKLLASVVHGGTENAKSWKWDTAFPGKRSYNQVVYDLKQALISEALQRSGGNKKQAARLLGMSIDALQKQIKTLSKKRV